MRFADDYSSGSEVELRSTTVERPSGSREVVFYEVSGERTSHRTYIAAEVDAVVSLDEIR